MHRSTTKLLPGLAVCLALGGGVAAQDTTDAPSIVPAGSAPQATSVAPPLRPTPVDPQDARLASPRSGRTSGQAPTLPFPVLLQGGNNVQGATPSGAPSGGGMLAPGCTAGEVYDDGTAENGLGGCGFGTDIIVVSQFTPPAYPYSYDQVCISWTRSAGDTALNYDIVLYDDDGAGGGPGTFLGSVPASASGIPLFPAVSAFFDYSVSFPSIHSGSVWLGVRFDEAVENCFFVSADQDNAHPDYWSSDGGTTFTLDQSGTGALLIRAEGNTTACGEGEVYDDGTGETGLGWNPTDGNVSVVNQFSPTEWPRRYDEICLAFTQTSGDSTLDFNLVMYDDDGPGGSPGTLLHSVPATATGVPGFPTIGAFETYSFPGAPAVYDGVVYIGANWDPAVEVEFFVGADTSGGNHPDYHTSDGGANWGLDVGGTQNLMIRADGTTFCEGGEIYDDGIAENGWGNTFTYIQVSEFTPSSYPFTYDEVCVGWTQNLNPGGSADLDFTIVVYDDDGAAGGPGTRLAELDTSVGGIPDFFDNPAGSGNYRYYRRVLDCGPVITSGSVWIGVEWDGISQPGRFLATDDSNNHPDYTNQDGAGFVLDFTGSATYMIRAGFSGDGNQVDASATPRNAGSNPMSFTADPPVMGQPVDMTVDLTTTGHNFAGVVAYLSPFNLTLGGGQVLLVNPLDPSGELLGLGLQPGPTANFSVTATIDLGNCGLTLSAQAVHFGGVQPFALSNAIDWVVGR